MSMTENDLEKQKKSEDNKLQDLLAKDSIQSLQELSKSLTVNASTVS